MAGLLMMLSGCAAPAPAIRLTPVSQLAPPVAVPHIDPLVLNPVPWTVYNRAGLDALVVKLKAQGDTSSVVFMLDANGLENLKLNFVELQRYLREQKAVIAMLIKIVDHQAGVVDSSLTATPPASPGASAP
jgi:hypothetical protein